MPRQVGEADVRCSRDRATAIFADAIRRKEAAFVEALNLSGGGEVEDRVAAIVDSYDPTQKRCYSIVTSWAQRRIANRSCAETLLFMTLGTAGTGKSHVIKGAAMRCRLLFRSFKSVRTMAPTGVAAANLGDGSCTIDSVFRTQSEEDLQDQALDCFCEELDELQLLIIDEISMLGSAALYIIHRRLLQLVKRRMLRAGCTAQQIDLFDKPFGGIGVWVVGDFGQLQPVRASSLLAGSRIVEPAETGRRSKAMCGCRLFQQFECVVRLRRVHRQAAVDEYKPSTLRLRDAAILPSDVDLWKSHDLDDNPAQWDGADGLEHSALTLVAENGLCGSINGERLRDFIKDQSVKLPGDVVVRCDAKHNVAEKASKRKAEEYRQLRSTLYLHVGAPVLLLLNKLYGMPVVPVGLMNGARGTVVAILYDGKGVVREGVEWVPCGTPLEVKNAMPVQIVVDFPGYLKSCNARISIEVRTH